MRACDGCHVASSGGSCCVEKVRLGFYRHQEKDFPKWAKAVN